MDEEVEEEGKKGSRDDELSVSGDREGGGGVWSLTDVVSCDAIIRLDMMSRC